MTQAHSRRRLRRWFEAQGVSVSGWARSEGLPVSVVYALLSGRTRGLRGKAHRAAVALGLKADPACTKLEFPHLTTDSDRRDVP